MSFKNLEFSKPLSFSVEYIPRSTPKKELFALVLFLPRLFLYQTIKTVKHMVAVFHYCPAEDRSDNLSVVPPETSLSAPALL